MSDPMTARTPAPQLIGHAYRDEVIYGATSRLTASQIFRALAAMHGDTPAALADGATLDPEDAHTAAVVGADDQETRLRLLGTLQAMLAAHWMHELRTPEVDRAYAFGFTTVMNHGADPDDGSDTPAMDAVITEHIKTLARLLSGQLANGVYPRENGGDLSKWLLAGLMTISQLYGAMVFDRHFTAEGHRAMIDWHTSLGGILMQPCMFPHMWPEGADTCPCGDHPDADDAS